MKKICLITGATSGIGLETAKYLVSKGYRLGIVTRNATKAKQTKLVLQKSNKNAAIDPFIADLSSQKEIRRLAKNVKKTYKKLDILINNAGVLKTTRTTTIDGIETTFAVNHLAYFLLTNLLLPLLKKATSARIINTASNAHYFANLNLEDLEYKKKYSAKGAYAQSKLANVLFTFELAKQLKNTNITVNCLHPGVVATGLWRDTSGYRGKIMKLISPLFNLIMISPKKGSETICYLATSHEVEHTSGKYFSNKKIKNPSKTALNRALGKKLWKLSEEMCGIC